MAERLSGETRKRIHAFCKAIKVTDGLDAKIAEELSTHMEDKLRAYLDGREKLTEADALLLVEHRFGDRAFIRDLLQTVHTGIAKTTIARRLAAMICLTSAFVGFEHLFRLALSAVFASLFQFGDRHVDSSGHRFDGWIIEYFHSDPKPSHYAVSLWITELVPIIIGVVGIWCVYRYWQRRLNAGDQLWFVRWSMGKFATLAVASFLAAQLAYAIPTLRGPVDFSAYRNLLEGAGTTCGLLFTGILSGWWCAGCRYKLSAASLFGVFGWTGWIMLLNALQPHRFRVSSDFLWTILEHSKNWEQLTFYAIIGDRPLELWQLPAIVLAILLMLRLFSRRFLEGLRPLRRMNDFTTA